MLEVQKNSQFTYVSLFHINSKREHENLKDIYKRERSLFRIESKWKWMMVGLEFSNREMVKSRRSGYGITFKRHTYKGRTRTKTNS